MENFIRGLASSIFDQLLNDGIIDLTILCYLHLLPSVMTDDGYS